MRIAILTQTFYSTSGISNVVKYQANALTRNGSIVTIFAFAGNMEPPQNVTLEILGMPKGFLREKLFNWLFPLNYLKSIQCAHALKGYDVIIAHFYPMTWVANLAKKLNGSKYIYYNHGFLDPDPFLKPSLVERTYQRINFLLQKGALRRVDRAISISHYCRGQLRDLVGIDSEVVYNAVDLERFNVGKYGSHVREECGIGDAPIVLHVGTILPNKGIHVLIDAFKLVTSHIPNARLILGGKHIYPSYSKIIRRMADDSALILGEIPELELPAYYAACDVYVSASAWEGFNLPLVEAQGCGKPVVAFRLGSHAEVVEDGKTGFLVPPGNTEALAEALVTLLKDAELRRVMGQNAREMVKKKFSLERFSGETCRAVVQD